MRAYMPAACPAVGKGEIKAVDDWLAVRRLDLGGEGRGNENT